MKTSKESFKKYGCHNRKPFKQFLKVQDGWHESGNRKMKTIPFRMSHECEYDLKTTDERCKDCGHSRTSTTG